MLQIDGSDHEWFGEGGGRAMLLTLIDDAMGLRMSVMRTGGTTEGVLSLLLAWFRAHGLPQAIYADCKAVYFSRKEGGHVCAAPRERVTVHLLLDGAIAQRWKAIPGATASRAPSDRAANSSDVEECSAERPAARVEEIGGGVRRRDPTRHGVAHFC